MGNLAEHVGLADCCPLNTSLYSEFLMKNIHGTKKIKVKNTVEIFYLISHNKSSIISQLLVIAMTYKLFF